MNVNRTNVSVILLLLGVFCLDLHCGNSSSSEEITSDSDTGSGSSSGSDTDTIEIMDLVVEHNPNSVLSCYVNWTTEIPTNSSVEFGIEGFQFRISDQQLVTVHRVLVIGMRAETTYELKAISISEDGTEYGDATTSYTTGELPFIVPVATLETAETGEFQRGWTLTNSQERSGKFPGVIVMFDEFGQTVWYYVHGTKGDGRGDVDTRYLENGNILVGAAPNVSPAEVDLAGNIVWEGPVQESPAMHHHFDKLPNGNYVTLRHQSDEDNPGVTGDVIVEITPEHEVEWSWNIFDHLVPDITGDWTHCNSVTKDASNGVLYLSCRNISAVFKISLEGNNDIIWRLGEIGDFEPDPGADFPWAAHQHDPEIQANGNILIYDNGNTDRPHSRIVEYQLDPDNDEALIVWEFPGDYDVDTWYTEDWYTNIWGDADRLENGNVLVNAGKREANTHSRIFEITPEGKVVWAIVLPQYDGNALGSYRAQRISPPPYVESL